MRDLIGITYDAGSGGPELTAAEWRQVETSLFVRDSNDIVVGGVRGGAVSNTGSSVTIAPLTAVIQPSAALGVYQAAFPAGAAELAKTIPAAHATLARVDALDVKFFDHEADGSGLRGADIQINQGTASGTPSAPTFTGVGWRLGTFAVPASGGGSPVWTPNASLIGYATAGGVLDVTTDPSNPRAGTVTYNRSTGALKYYNGSTWVTVLAGGTTVGSASSVDVSTASTTFIAGSSAFGVTFVAPPSGKVLITLSGYFTQNQDGGVALMSYTVRTGGVLGSGSVVGTAANADRALIAGGVVESGQPNYCGGSHGPVLWTGLTPGDTYNVRVEIACDNGGGIDVKSRGLTVMPAL